jgi:fibronectin-binding autotransporter adhesin
MKKIFSLLSLILFVSVSYAASVDDVFWFGGTGDWMTQSNWSELDDGTQISGISYWYIPGWISGNTSNDGSWTSTSNKGFAIIAGGTANVTSSSKPDGRVERFYVGGSSGANLNISDNLTVYRAWVGTAAADIGTVTQTAGTVTLSGSSYIGDNGAGTYNISGGTFTSSGELRIGTNGGSSGAVNVSGGTFASTNANFSLGYYGNAALNLTGGAVTITGTNAYIGRYGDNAGVTNVNISNGTFSITSASTATGTSDGIFLGRSGTGNINQTGGTMNLTATNSQICVGYYRSGTTNFSNGAMSAKQYVIGYTNANTNSTLNMSGGTLAASGNMYLGYYWPAGATTATATTGNFNLSGGTVNITGSVYDGRSGNGHITVSGGSFNAGGMFLSLYYNSSTQPQASSLTISGGSFILANQLSTYSEGDVITVSGSDATKISVGHLVIRSSATLAIELDAGGVTPIEVGDTTGQVDIQNITFKVSTLPDYVGGIGTTYDVLKTTTGKIDISGATLVQETGAKHTFSYAVVDDGNGGQILRLTEIQGTCGDALHPIVDGDLNEDCVVDYLDVKEIANSWLDCSFDCP